MLLAITTAGKVPADSPEERTLLDLSGSNKNYKMESGPDGKKFAQARSVKFEQRAEGKDGVLKINYNLGWKLWNSHLLWVTSPEKITADDLGLSVYIKGPVSATVSWIIVDATGQTHHRLYTLSGYNWDRLQWLWKSPRANEKRKLEKHHGGANDGIVHLPIKKCAIGVNRWLSPQSGILYIDKLCAVESLPAVETVSVDFSKQTGPVTGRASGFIHSISLKLPVDDDVKPVKPKLFRIRPVPFPYNMDSKNKRINIPRDEYERTTGMASCPRLFKLGAKVQPIISDEFLVVYSKHGKGRFPGDGGKWDTFREMLAKLVAKGKKYNGKIEWDIWNEPDYYGFWRRPRKQYYQTWKVGHDELRKLDKDAAIVGPSAANYSRDFIKAFLLEAKKNKALPDVLSWHEMGFRRNGYKCIAAHIRDIREFMKQHHINIEKISINEYVGPQDAYSAGVHVAYLSQLEQGKVDSAAHATWKGEAVWGLTLDGLLTYPERKRTGTWWIYKAYADMSGSLVKVDDAMTTFALASFDRNSKTARILIGRDAEMDSKVKLSLNSLPADMQNKGKIHVRISKIADTAGKAAKTPPVILENDLEVVNGRLSINIPDLGLKDACYIELSAP